MPRPDLFLEGLSDALTTARMAMPQYIIMGMSIERIVDSLEEAKAPMHAFEMASGLGLATWHDAAKAALDSFQAKKIALLTPFDTAGHVRAIKVFEQLGYEVVRSVCFNCSNSLDIGHVPSEAKEHVIRQYLANDARAGGSTENVDAIVQCGTNFSLTAVIEKVERDLDVPVLGINQTLLWYSLRECGITEKLEGCGRLFREF